MDGVGFVVGSWFFIWSIGVQVIISLFTCIRWYRIVQYDRMALQDVTGWQQTSMVQGEVFVKVRLHNVRRAMDAAH